MCDNNSCGCEPEKTNLQLAVLEVVRELVRRNNPFSIHDVTVFIRKACNSGLLEVSDCVDTDPDAEYEFNIEHARVREAFNELWSRGVLTGDIPTLTRNHNGRFWEFSGLNKDVDLKNDPTGANPPLTPLPTTDPNCRTNTTVQDISGYSLNDVKVKVSNNTVQQPVDDVVKNRIKNYLTNYRGSYPPSAKMVQSAIKRGNKSTGLSCEEIRKISSDLGATLS